MCKVYKLYQDPSSSPFQLHHLEEGIEFRSPGTRAAQPQWREAGALNS
jgi:hypothetical protein